MTKRMTGEDRATIQQLAKKYTPAKVSKVALSVDRRSPGRPADQDINAGFVWVWIENFRLRTPPLKPLSVAHSADELEKLLAKYTAGHKLTVRSIRGLHDRAKKLINSDSEYGVHLREELRQRQLDGLSYVPLLMRRKPDGSLEAAAFDTWALRPLEVG